MDEGEQQAVTTVEEARPAATGQDPGSSNGHADPHGPIGKPPRSEHNAVIQHLLFHKALADHDPDRLDAYIELARHEVAHFRDPVDQAIALAFTLVFEEHLDPWSIDLVQFSNLYAERLQDAEEVDLITGGRLLALAWHVLLAQSEELVVRAQPPEPEADPWALPWDDFPELDYDEETADYTQRVLRAREAPISEAVFHQGDRRVTLYELVEALEEARTEAEVRMRLAAARREARDENASQGKKNMRKIHKEDLEAEILDVRRRIQRIRGEVTMAAIHDGTREDFLTAFVACLFLSRANMVDLRQEDFPIGPILLTPMEAIHDMDAPLIGLPKKGAIAAAGGGKGGDNGKGGGQADAKADVETDATTGSTPEGEDEGAGAGGDEHGG